MNSPPLFHANMAEKHGHEKLCEAAGSFLSDFHFGHVEIEAVMEEIFGTYATRQKSAAAISWATYWRDLSIYDEARREGSQAVLPNPKPSGKPTEWVKETWSMSDITGRHSSSADY